MLVFPACPVKTEATKYSTASKFLSSLLRVFCKGITLRFLSKIHNLKTKNLRCEHCLNTTSPGWLSCSTWFGTRALGAGPWTCSSTISPLWFRTISDSATNVLRKSEALENNFTTSWELPVVNVSPHTAVGYLFGG